MDNNTVKYKCVYKIECLVNSKVYIGQTYYYKNRIKRHFSDLAKNKHFNKYLQLDYNTYGKNYFKVSILEDKIEPNIAKRRETYYIKLYGDIESSNVYNYDNNITQNTEKCTAISSTLKRKIHNGEYTPYKLAVCGENNPAKRPEVKQKLSKILAGKGNGMYGKKHTLESRRKMSEALKGRIPWNKNKSNIKLIGIPCSESTKQKISETRKQRIAEGKIKSWNKGKRKYTTEFVEEVRLKYAELNYSKNLLIQCYPNINKQTLFNLVKYGTSQHPSSYKK